MGAEPGLLTDSSVQALDAYWRAANYLSVGQIYLMANPLLTEPLRAEQIKPRLLGHWGTSPGLNFVWAHLSRAITAHGTEMMIVIGPGHGGPAALANAWLEGSYSEVYPSVPRNGSGMATLFRQFSFPGGVPSHVAPETPGSIHEGGELGYSLSHACGAAFDNPGLVVACVVGDGEAETGPMATSWHGCRFLDPARDGAVLPILHLNGYKIANPALLARLPEDELDALLRGYGYRPRHVTGHEPFVMHQKMAAALEESLAEIRERLLQRRRHFLMHNEGLVAGHVPRPIAVPAQQRVEFVFRQAGQQCRVGDLVAVEVEDGQHRAIPGRVEEPAAVPARGHRAGLGLPVADHARDHQARVVERRAAGVRQRVAQFAALVDGPGCLRRDVAGHPAGEGELPEQRGHARAVARHARVDLRVAALQPGVGQRRGPAVAGPDDDHHLRPGRGDRAGQVRPDEVQAGGGAPVPEQPRLDVLGAQRLGQQRVGHQVDLAHGQVVGRAPVGVEGLDAAVREQTGLSAHRRCGPRLPGNVPR